VDIEIEFVNGRHQDNISFAEMNTIAHAFYPVQAGGHALRVKLLKYIKSSDLAQLQVINFDLG